MWACFDAVAAEKVQIRLHCSVGFAGAVLWFSFLICTRVIDSSFPEPPLPRERICTFLEWALTVRVRIIKWITWLPLRPHGSGSDANRTKYLCRLGAITWRGRFQDQTCSLQNKSWSSCSPESWIREITGAQSSFTLWVFAVKWTLISPSSQLFSVQFGKSFSPRLSSNPTKERGARSSSLLSSSSCSWVA